MEETKRLKKLLQVSIKYYLSRFLPFKKKSEQSNKNGWVSGHVVWYVYGLPFAVHN